MKKIILFTLTLIAVGLNSCDNAPKVEQRKDEVIEFPTIVKDKSYISIFEIPATDLNRAVTFYETILEMKIEKYEMPGMNMGVMPYLDQLSSGVIMQGEGYVPSANGVTIYLNGGNDLQPILDKVERNGGEIIAPKTAHADESGFFALFLDTEGNRIGLNSTN